MTLIDQLCNDIPEYYDFMYLDGYKPWQIMVANHKRFQRMIAERQEQQEQDEPINIKIKSEVKVK